MPNQINKQVLIDSTNRALIKYVIIFDGTNENDTNILDAASLKYALNTAGYIMTNRLDPKPIYKTSIKRIFGSSSNGGLAHLKWDGTADQSIVSCSGMFDYNFDYSGGGIIQNIANNSTGNVLISTSGFSSNSAMTLIIDLKKDNSDFDAGQSNDPGAFNFRR